MTNRLIVVEQTFGLIHKSVLANWDSASSLHDMKHFASSESGIPLSFDMEYCLQQIRNTVSNKPNSGVNIRCTYLNNP